MRKSLIKKLFMFTAAAGMMVPAQAQFLRSSYFMEGASSRLQMNPGLQPTRGFFNIPVLGSFNVSANSNVLGINDIVDVVGNGNSTLYTNDHLYNHLRAHNDLNLNVNTDLLSFGWFKGKNFWNVNLGLRMDVGARFAKGMFDFMSNLNGYRLDGLSGKSHHYDMNNQEIDLKAYTELGVGFSRQFTEKLTAGVRVKALFGLGRTTVDIEQFDVNMDLPEIPNDPYYNNWVGGRYSYRTKGKIVTTLKGGGIVDNNGDGLVDDFDYEASDMGLAGGGLGFDFGASYDITDNLTVSAALLDVGFLKWKSSATSVGAVDGSGDVVIDESNYGKYMDGDFLDVSRYDFVLQDNVSYKSKTSLSSTLLLAGEYAFFDRKLSVGAMYTVHFVQPKALHDVTFSATYRPRNWFNIAGSYSPVLASGKSIGLAMKLGPLFLGTDYMYFGKNSKSANAYLGISIPMGQKRWMSDNKLLLSGKTPNSTINRSECQ